MSDLSEIFGRLSGTSSINEKRAILRENEGNLLLRHCFLLAEDPFINFWQKPKVPAVHGEAILTQDLLNAVKETLCDRKLTGNSARDWLTGVMESLTTEDQTVLFNVISKDMNCHVGRTLVQDTWDNMVPEMPCMLAEKLNQKTAKNFVETEEGETPLIIVQTKCDGLRVHFSVNKDGRVLAYTRSGKELLLHGVFDEVFSVFPRSVFDGELLVKSSEGVEDRATGNGFGNKAVRGTITKEEASRFKVILWDVIPYEVFWNDDSYLKPYKLRYEDLSEMVLKMDPGKVELVNTQFVHTLDEARTFYREQLAKGLEGAMIKRTDMPWQNKRSAFMCKMKDEIECTLRCVGVLAHNKKIGQIGALVCESEDGGLRTSIGSGLTDGDRKTSGTQFIGKLVSVKYNAVIKSKGKDLPSLFLPIFKGIREDTVTADSTAKIIGS